MPTPLASVPDSVRTGWRTRLLQAAMHDPLPVGLVAVTLLAGTSVLLGFPLDVPLLVLGGCGTTVLYAADRGLSFSPEDTVNRPVRATWMTQHRGWILVESAMLFVVGVAMMTQVKAETLAVATVLGGIGALHVLPVLPGGRRLKAWGWAKPVSITLVWALGSTLLPAVEAGGAPSLDVVGTALYRSALIAPNVLLIDWADTPGDVEAGLSSWADGWTIGQVRRLCAVVGGSAAVIGGVMVPAEPSLLWMVDGAGLLAMATAIATLRPDRRTADAFWLDVLVAWPAWTALVAGIASVG